MSDVGSWYGAAVEALTITERTAQALRKRDLFRRERQDIFAAALEAAFAQAAAGAGYDQVYESAVAAAGQYLQ
ncbi:MAG: hypothetical protein ACPLRM_02480, partial [Anaerolineae bacterium]